MIPDPSFEMLKRVTPTPPQDMVSTLRLVYETEVVTSIKSLNQTQTLKVSTIIFQTFKAENIEPEIIGNLLIIFYSNLNKLKHKFVLRQASNLIMVIHHLFLRP